MESAPNCRRQVALAFCLSIRVYEAGATIPFQSRSLLFFNLLLFLSLLSNDAQFAPDTEAGGELANKRFTKLGPTEKRNKRTAEQSSDRPTQIDKRTGQSGEEAKFLSRDFRIEKYAQHKRARKGNDGRMNDGKDEGKK